MTDDLLEEILKQLRITNLLLATLKFEHPTTLKQQGYQFDEIPLKEYEINEFLKKITRSIES